MWKTLWDEFLRGRLACVDDRWLVGRKRGLGRRTGGWLEALFLGLQAARSAAPTSRSAAPLPGGLISYGAILRTSTSTRWEAHYAGAAGRCHAQSCPWALNCP